MNLMEFKGLLETINIPVEYQAFPVGNAPDLPYVLWYEDDSDNFKADNTNYFDVINVVVELYSDEKDLELETKINKLFYDNEIEYDFNESFISDENMYLKAYEVTITFDSQANFKPVEIDKSQLQALVDYSDTLKADYYILETFTKFKTSLAYAKAILIDEDATQSEVDDSSDDLIQALSQLILIVVTVDKSQLQSQVDYVNTITPSNYTQETWSALIIVKANAKSVLSNSNAKQSEIDSALIELFKAINNLKLVEGGFTKGVNLYAPLYWQSIGRTGHISNDGVVNLSQYSSSVVSPLIEIPTNAYYLYSQIQSSESVYAYLYDSDQNYITYNFLYTGSTKVNLSKQAKYMYIQSYKQTPSSLATAKIKLEYNTQSEYTLSPEDEPFNILTKI